MNLPELMTWLQSQADEDLIHNARSIPFTHKLDIYQMHGLALVLATRLELADRAAELYRRTEAPITELEKSIFALDPENPGDWRREPDDRPLDGMAAENASDSMPIFDQGDTGASTGFAAANFVIGANFDAVKKELAERAAEWKAP